MGQITCFLWPRPHICGCRALVSDPRTGWCTRYSRSRHPPHRSVHGLFATHHPTCGHRRCPINRCPTMVYVYPATGANHRQAQHDWHGTNRKFRCRNVFHWMSIGLRSGQLHAAARGGHSATFGAHRQPGRFRATAKSGLPKASSHTHLYRWKRLRYSRSRALKAAIRKHASKSSTRIITLSVA